MQNLDLSKFWFYRLEVEGWLAHFRQPTTVTTRLTYLLPTKSGAIGMLLAKLGLYKRSNENFSLLKSKEYRDTFNNTLIAISLKGKVVKYTDYVNYTSNKIKRKPTLLEYLVNPSYEFIYLLPKDDKLLGEKNKDLIVNNEIFKVYLGYNECPATIRISEEIKEDSIKIVKTKEGTINTEFILPTEAIDVSMVERYKNSSYLLRSSILVSLPEPTEKVEETLEEKEILVPLRKMEFKLKEDVPILEFNSKGKIRQFLVV